MSDVVKFENIVDRQGSILAEVNLLQIVDKDTMEIAQGLLSQINTLKKGISAFCDENVNTAHRAWKAATAMRAALLVPTNAADQIIRGKLKVFAAEERKKREEAERKIREEQAQHAPETPEEEIITPAPQVRVEIATDSGGFRTEWRWEIIDESKIPRMYLIPDEKTISALVRSQKGRCNIPGIKVFAEDIPVSAKK